MKIMNKLTISNLKLNKKRTIVTIIGIILSVALITSLSTLISSFKSSLHNFYIQQRGNYHYAFFDISDDDLEVIKKNKKIESYSIIEDIGYALINSKNEYKPYVHILGIDNNDYNNLSIHLISGRMPENSDEIVIAKHLKNNGSVDLKIGDTIDLKIGKRVSDGYTLNSSNPYDDTEKISIKETKTYKVVGIIERPIYNIEAYSSPGYTVITNRTQNHYSSSIYVRYTKAGLKYRYRVTANILGISEKLYEDTKGGMLYNTDKEYDMIEEELSKAKFTFSENSNLIYLETMPANDYTVRTLYTTFVVVALIIIATSVFCIKNSFDIQVSEKQGLFGMLRSVGATKKQIKKSVLYEGFILGLIGIPIGIISGLFASFILIKVCNSLLNEQLFMNFTFNVSFLAIIVAVVLSVLTIYLSSIKSAKRASKTSPIALVRNSSDIKNKKFGIKTSKFIKKLFGIGGLISYKNIKRNKKKYRTIVISLIVCISVFIATTSFVSYAFKQISIEFPDAEYNISLRVKSDNKTQIDAISKIDSIKSIDAKRDASRDVTGIKLTKDFSDFLDGNDKLIDAYISSHGSTIYKNYLDKLNLSYEDAKDKVILINKTMITDSENPSIKKEIITSNNKVNDTISIKLDDSTIDLSIIKVTDIKPMFSDEVYARIELIVSDEVMDKLTDSEYTNIFIDSTNPDYVEAEIKKILDNDSYTIHNLDKEKREIQSLYTLVAIFLYGFITVIALIGITNIFNTITTSMFLRSKEFAMLKSVGMTNKEFNKMIFLESIMTCFKSLLIGIPIGIFLSYIMYLSMNIGINKVMYNLPITGILISILSVIVLILVIMKYSLNKINKQNIIETIRKDNI